MPANSDPSLLVATGPTDDEGQPLPACVEGLVNIAPTTVHDLMHVTIPSFDNNVTRFGPCPWGPERSGVLPQPGDRVLVQFSDIHGAWVVNWWPSSYGGL